MGQHLAWAPAFAERDAFVPLLRGRGQHRRRTGRGAHRPVRGPRAAADRAWRVRGSRHRSVGVHRRLRRVIVSSGETGSAHCPAEPGHDLTRPRDHHPLASLRVPRGSALHRRNDIYYLTWSETRRRPGLSGAVGHGPDAVRSVAAPRHPSRAGPSSASMGCDTSLPSPPRRGQRDRYHRFAVPDGDGFHREIAIDRLRYADNGDLLPVLPLCLPWIFRIPTCPAPARHPLKGQ